MDIIEKNLIEYYGNNNLHLINLLGTKAVYQYFSLESEDDDGFRCMEKSVDLSLKIDPKADKGYLFAATLMNNGSVGAKLDVTNYEKYIDMQVQGCYIHINFLDKNNATIYDARLKYIYDTGVYNNSNIGYEQWYTEKMEYWREYYAA